MQTANLQAFISVAETGSFSRSAEQLHLTQSAISKRIAVLEQTLDSRLFDRIGHKVLLTEAGRALLPRARRILAEIDDSRRALRNLSGEVSGRLSLGTSHHIGLHRLPPVLCTYSTRYREVELDLHFMASEAVCAAVAHGDLELGIITLPLVIPPDLQATVVWPDPLGFVCGHNHPLAKAKTIQPQHLAKHSAVLPERETTTREILENSLRERGIPIMAGTATNNLETIRMMVSIDLGWSLLPRTMIDKELHEFHVDGIRLSRSLGVVRHTERTLSNAASAILDVLTQERG